MSGPGAQPRITVTDLGGRGPAVVLGPSLGTTSIMLWGQVAEELLASFRVLLWDLPGHGGCQPATGITTDGLARGLLGALEQAVEGPVAILAGDSLGGAVSLEAALVAPSRASALVIACSGPRIGEPAAWRQRAQQARSGGLDPGGPIRAAAAQRWFGPGFAGRSPALADRLVTQLSDVDPASYASCCEALASFDLRPRLPDLGLPVLAVAGSDDVVTPPPLLRHLATGVPHGRFVQLDGVGHLAPAEAPRAVASLISDHARHSARPPLTGPGTTARARADGMRVRREVLGDDHVDRASAGATEFTADFQALIATYAWGSIWTREGLDRRSRSVAVLTALVARGHHEELEMHLRAALRNGLSVGEIKEVLLQAAIYCGVPEANSAFRIAATTLSQEGAR